MSSVKNSILCGLAILASTVAPQVAAQATCLAAPTERFPVTTGPGFTSQLLLTSSLSSPRSIRFDSAGNLLVVNNGQGVYLVQLAENADGTPCVTATRMIIQDTTLNHGIDFSADGKTLFVSSLATVYAYDYDSATGNATNQKTIITDMTQTSHSTRTLLVSKANPDILLVSRGSQGNIDTGALDAANGRSVIKYYSISEALAAPIDMSSGGTLLGMGLRNSVGVAENPMTGEIWSVENSMDEVLRLGADIHNDNPAEELNFHGKLNDTTNTLLGSNYGYPTCVAAWAAADLSNPALKVGSQFIPNLEAGLDPATEDAACADVTPPRLSFPAHAAPLDITFNSNATAAYISFHGSWNRDVPDGYRLMKIAFGADGQPTEPIDSTTASIPVLQNTDLNNCPDSCFRPVGLAFDPKGRLFMSSDSSNEIYVIKGDL